MLCNIFKKNIYFTLYYCFVFQCTHRPFASLSIICEWIIHFLPQSPVKAAALCVLLGFYLSCVHLWSDWSQTVVPCI